MIALHARISADLAERIRSGDWPPGRRIPFEHELTAQYGCARATAGKAVQALVAAGLVERRRRAGTFVASPRIQTAVLRIPELHAEVTRRGQVYACDLIERRIRSQDASDPDEAMLTGGGEVVELRCLHRADGRPLAIEDRLIRIGATPSVADVDFNGVSPGAWLLANVPWSDAEHRIGAVAADAATAEALDVPVGAACLLLRRWTWRIGEGITLVKQRFAPHSFELVAHFTSEPFT